MKKFMKILKGLVILGALSVAGFYLVCALLPKPDLVQNTSIRLYDDEMTVFYKTSNQASIEWISYQNIPQEVIDATLSIEDKRYFQHFGIDPLRLTKAAWLNITHNRIVQGGSTITQQLAKNLYLTQEQTIQRKLQELVYATQLEMHYTKEEILENYLNTIYFGHGVTGINTAAHFFFDRDLQDCTLAQITMLVGIPNGPAYYSPFNDYEGSKKRQRTVLNAMVANSVLSEEEADRLYQEDIQLADYTIQVEKNIYGYYKDAVFSECKALGYCTEAQMEAGLDIYTYYDSEIQSVLQKTIDVTMAESSQQTAMIVVEPFTFKVQAISGGTRYTDTQYNRALYSKRQVGSTIKPLLYYIALNQGFKPDTTFLSAKTSFQLTQTVAYTPENYKDLYANIDISLIHAISTSDNVYAIKTHLYLGMNMLLDALESFGIHQKEATASMALGTTDFPLIDLAKIYNTFASEGLTESPSFIKCIKDSEGNILYQRQIQPKQLLDQDDTLVLTSLLRAPFDIKNNYVSGPSLLGYEPYTTVAAKSGSSDWDSLIAGYNPQMTLVVWTGYDENQALTTTDERRLSRKMFQTIWNTIYPKDNPGPWYQPNSHLEERRVNPITGQLDNNGSLYWFKKTE